MSKIFHAFCNKCQKWVHEMFVKDGYVFCEECKEIIGPSKNMHYSLIEIEK